MRRILPRLRLLHAVPRGHRDQPVCAHVAHAAPRPAAAWLTEEWQQKMHQIENCRHCGHCMSKCPYGLNTPELLRQTTRTTGKCSRPARRRNEAGFSQKYAVRPLTAGDVDKILALCAENEQFYRYHPPLATRESVLEDMTRCRRGNARRTSIISAFRQRNARRCAGPDRALPAR